MKQMSENKEEEKIKIEDTPKQKGIFLAAALEMFDEGFNTIGGLEKGIGTKDLFLEAYTVPTSGRLTSSSVLSRNTEDVVALKAKHYAIGLAACKYINMYLSALSTKSKAEAAFFVDPVSNPASYSCEIIYLSNWILCMRKVSPKTFFFGSREEIGKEISKLVGHSITSLHANENTRADMEEVKSLWKSFAEGYFTRTKERSDKATEDEKRVVSNFKGKFKYMEAITCADAISKHLVDIETKTALCGMRDKEIFCKNWIFGTFADMPIHAGCEDEAIKRGILVLDEGSSLGWVKYRSHVYYVHLAPRDEDYTLCDCKAPPSGWCSTFNLMDENNHLCSRCVQEAKEAGKAFPLGFEEEIEQILRVGDETPVITLGAGDEKKEEKDEQTTVATPSEAEQN